MNAAARRLLLVCLLVGLVPAVRADDEARQRRRSPVVEVFEKSRDAVVNISTTRVMRTRTLRHESILDDVFDFGAPRLHDQRVQSVGSGIVVHESGYVVTNAHVVTQAADVRVTLADQRTLPAELVAVDPEHDLAVLKLKAAAPLAHIKLGRSDDLMIGETVIAIGNPLGLQHTVTTGIISALNRELEFSPELSYKGLIQTDAPINPGNSGGPLLNINAELIGINTAIRGDAQNIGFAIPVDSLWELLPQMLDIERHERVRFGLRVNGPRAEVVEVRAGSPAAGAKVQVGDRVVRFHDEAIRDSIDYYVHLLGQKPDSEVLLAVQRGADTLNMRIPLQSVPLPDGKKLAKELLGVELAPVPDDLRRKLELGEAVGLIVETVDRGSPAERARMQRGDLVLGLDRLAVSDLRDVGLVLEKVAAGQPIVVEGVRWESDPPFRWTVSIRTRKH